jgi:hypothetical protein
MKQLTTGQGKLGTFTTNLLTTSIFHPKIVNYELKKHGLDSQTALW